MPEARPPYHYKNPCDTIKMKMDNTHSKKNTARHETPWEAKDRQLSMEAKDRQLSRQDTRGHNKHWTKKKRHVRVGNAREKRPRERKSHAPHMHTRNDPLTVRLAPHKQNNGQHYLPKPTIHPSAPCRCPKPEPNNKPQRPHKRGRG